MTAIPPDETLDRLLLALIQSPRDTTLCAIIGDRLLDIGHPAAAWWRELVVRFERRSYWRFGHFVWPADYLDAKGLEPQYPGVSDLCSRLDAGRRELKAARRPDPGFFAGVMAMEGHEDAKRIVRQIMG